MYLKIIFTLTNSSYPDEMQHFAALHLGLRCLSKYSLRSQMVKHPCTFIIHCTQPKTGRANRIALYGKTKLNLMGWIIRYIPSWTVLIPYFTLVLRSKPLTTLRNLANPYLFVMQLIETVTFRNKFVANLSQYVVLP